MDEYLLEEVFHFDKCLLLHLEQEAGALGLDRELTEHFLAEDVEVVHAVFVLQESLMVLGLYLLLFVQDAERHVHETEVVSLRDAHVLSILVEFSRPQLPLCS